MAGGSDDDLVMGEPRAVLREAMLGLATHRSELAHGGLHLSGEIPELLADPFLRALGRVGDELQADDRRRGVTVREGPTLHAAAFMALLLRVSDTQSG